MSEAETDVLCMTRPGLSVVMVVLFAPWWLKYKVHIQVHRRVSRIDEDDTTRHDVYCLVFGMGPLEVN